MGYHLPSFPEIDYTRHPAYGAVLGRPGMVMRLRALQAFARGFALIAGRWLLDYEHLPKPEDKAHKLRWMVLRLPKYLRLVAAQRWQRLTARDRHNPTTTAGAAALGRLQDDGIFTFSLDTDQRRRLHELLAPHFSRLAASLARIPPDQRRFDDNRLWVDAARNPEVYAWFRSVLAQAGVLEAACAYLKRPVDVAHVIPQINTTTDTFWGRHFADVEVASPVCDYCHFDATYRVVKLMVYLDAVGPDNGPFSYVRGSQRAGTGFWDGIVRRANDYAGLSSTERAARELFIALPRWLQRKAAFGPDIPAGSPYIRPILDNEWVITSDQGQGIVFDPQGIHRGGMVRAGVRRVVSVMLAQTQRG